MSTTVTAKTYIEKLEPGSLVPEEYIEEVADRDPQRDAGAAGQRVFAFRYYDIETTWGQLVDGGWARLDSKKTNVSGFYYIDAEEMTVPDIIELDRVEGAKGRYNILIRNMKGNGWDSVFRCRTGNFRPKEDGDTVINL